MLAEEDELSTNANEAINFYMVSSDSDLPQPAVAFHPEYTHQHFGMKEKIFGYLRPKVDIFYSKAALDMFVRFTYERKFSPAELKGIMVDDVMRIITADIPKDALHLTMDNFTASLHSETKFSPWGRQMCAYTSKPCGENNNTSDTFEVYFMDKREPHFAQFLPYFLRVQYFLLYFVDGAFHIDDEDEQWKYFLLYRRRPGTGGEGPSFTLVGYMTAFLFYAYPEHIRPRLSQMLILPPFQRQSHGTHLLQTFYDWVATLHNVRDCTVEDPNEDFQQMRDKLDMHRAIQHSLECSKSVADVLRENLFLNRRQAARVSDLMKLREVRRAPTSKERMALRQKFQDMLKERFKMQSVTSQSKRIFNEGIKYEALHSAAQEQELAKAVTETIEIYEAVIDSYERSYPV